MGYIAAQSQLVLLIPAYMEEAFSVVHLLPEKAQLPFSVCILLSCLIALSEQSVPICHTLDGKNFDGEHADFRQKDETVGLRNNRRQSH